MGQRRKTSLLELTLRRLTKKYGQKLILDQVTQSFSSDAGISAIVGESGAGKSTLLNLLFGSDQRYSGQYLINGHDAQTLTAANWAGLRSHKIQMVYQDFKLLSDLTVAENIEFAERRYNGDYQARKEQLLQLLGIQAIANAKVRDISGGQKQRVAIARALLNEPELLLLDEPTGNLDQRHTTELLDYLAKIKRRGVGILIVTHDERVLPYADKIFRLQDGQLQAESSVVPSSIPDHFPPVSEAADVPLSPAPARPKTPAKVRLKYIWVDLLQKWRQFCLASIPQILILAVFMLILTGLKQVLLGDITATFQGFASNVIQIDTQTLTQSAQKRLSQKGIDASVDQNRLYFSQQDLDQVRRLPQVQQAFLFNTSQLILDLQGNELQESLAKDKLPATFKKYPSYIAAPTELLFAFRSLTLPASKLNYYDPQKINLQSGTYPTTANEILVPDFFKEYLVQSGRSGQRVRLHVRSEQAQFVTKAYQISGTYQTDYRRQLQPNVDLNYRPAFAIYTAYHQIDELALQLTRKAYAEKKDSYQVNAATKAYSQKLVGTYEQYQRSMGLGQPSMLIVARNAAQIPQLTKELARKYPLYQQMSQYSLSHGDFATTYRQLLLILVAGIVVVAALLIVIFVFLNKQSLRHRRQEMGILISLGYQRGDVKRIIAGEIISQLGLIYLGALLVVKLLHQFLIQRFSFANYFVDLYTWSNQGLILLVLLLVMFFSVLWGLTVIRKNRLSESLK